MHSHTRASSRRRLREDQAQPSTMELRPPGAESTREEGRSEMKLPVQCQRARGRAEGAQKASVSAAQRCETPHAPVFWLAPFAKAFWDTPRRYAAETMGSLFSLAGGAVPAGVYAATGAVGLAMTAGALVGCAAEVTLGAVWAAWAGGSAQPKEILLAPPGGARRRVVERPVMTLPVGWRGGVSGQALRWQAGSERTCVLARARGVSVGGPR